MSKGIQIYVEKSVIINVKYSLSETGNVLYSVITRSIYHLNHNEINRLMFIKHVKSNIGETFKDRDVCEVLTT